MAFAKFPHIENNGILKSFYNKNPKYYEDDIIIYASSHNYATKNENIYDFNESTYWIALKEQQGDYFNSFCFKKGFAFLTGYEVTANNNAWKPSEWSFAGSNDNETWENNVSEKYVMNGSEIHHVNWNHGPYRCFKLTTLNNACNNNDRRADYVQIEIFGYYCNDVARIKTCGNKKYHSPFTFHFITLFATIS